MARSRRRSPPLLRERFSPWVDLTRSPRRRPNDRYIARSGRTLRPSLASE
jgi:hypothetical protein